MAAVRVLTLNVGSFFEADWDRRRHEVVAWLDRADADIICLQEVWQDREVPNTAGWIVDHVAASYEWTFGGHALPTRRESQPDLLFGSAVLSRWAIDEVHQWALPIADDPEDPMPASMPWELVHARTAGIDVFTTHLAPAPQHGRHRLVQVQTIDTLIRAVRGDRDTFVEFSRPRRHMPAILTGDFNAEPDSDEMRWLRGHAVINDRTTFFQDAWVVAGDGSRGLTQDWRTHPLAAGLNVHPKRIDYVYVADPFLRAGNSGRILNAQIIADRPLTGILASDHMGLLVEIEWADRPAR